jgi:hypothetical protein
MRTKYAINIGNILSLKEKDVEKADHRKSKDVYYVSQCSYRIAWIDGLA